MNKFVVFLSFIIIFWVGAEFTVQAHESDEDHKVQLADYLDFETVSNPQISPDGSTILYTRRRIDKLNDKFVSTLWLMDTNGENKRQLLKGSAGKWSPDGSKIAYLGKDDNDKAQIYVRHMDSDGLVSQVTSFEHTPRSFFWSPDGHKLAFVARVPLKNTWKIKLPEKPKGAKWTEDPVVIDTLHYRQDRVGYTNSGYDHIFTVPSIGGTARQLTQGDWNVGRRALGVIAGSPILSWSPDGTKIAFDGPGKPLENPHWFESHIHVIDILTGETSTLTQGRATFGSPQFSPDGTKIAFSGYAEHNTSYPVPKLYVMEVDGTGNRILAEDLADGPSSINWAGSGKEIYFTMNEHGARNIHVVNLDGVKRAVTSGPQMVGLSSMSHIGIAAVTITNSELPGAIATVSTKRSVKDLIPLTDVNSDIFENKTFGRVEEIWYESTAETGESAKIQGWIVYPPDFDANETYPLLLSIHGGPHAMYNSGFNFTFQEFAARGYVVLYTNPRGSTGYGSEFANAIRHRYPGPIDYADLINGVDTVLDKGFIDPERLFVTGCSGGGVLTTWMISQTDRFKAAAALCPVVNWIGMSGTTDVVGWLYNFFPKPFWEDPKPWLDHSTIMQVGNVNTPTLLMTGTKDLRTPLGEAEEYFAALKVRGVPTKLIPMVNEYHGTRSIPSNYLRTSLMMRKWFSEFDPVSLEDSHQNDPKSDE